MKLVILNQLRERNEARDEITSVKAVNICYPYKACCAGVWIYCNKNMMEIKLKLLSSHQIHTFFFSEVSECL